MASSFRTACAANRRIVAVGEIGLDFWDGRCDCRRQLAALQAQLELAAELGLPVVLHNRKGWPDFFGLIRDLGIKTLAGMVHAFNGGPRIARQLLDLGLMFSFGGPITYAKARWLRETVAEIPLDRLLTETDTPDLPAAAARHRGSRPWDLEEVVAAMAELKGLPPAELATIVATNFRRLFPAAADDHGNAKKNRGSDLSPAVGGLR
jgi:TatD DNase family protein